MKMPVGNEEVPLHLQKYVDYINNTGRRPLSESAFDDDWEPIGPLLRRQLLEGGFIYRGGHQLPFPTQPGIFLRPDLVRNSA
jgi:hypothetical protein